MPVNHYYVAYSQNESLTLGLVFFNFAADFLQSHF